MKDKRDQEPAGLYPGGCITPPMVVSVADHEFECEVLDRLGRLETKIDTLVGNGQPGRMKCAEERLSVLERSDIRRGVYDRLINGFIALVVSAAIALHDHFGLR
jgi:hypothetical protein